MSLPPDSQLGHTPAADLTPANLVVRLGQIPPEPDPRDANFTIHRLLTSSPPPTTTIPRTSRVWGPGPVIDQGQTPECVGFSGRGWLTATPIRYTSASPTPQDCYAGAQRFDGDPQPHDGSDDHGLMKYFQEQGLVKSYHWATGIEDAIAFILYHGTLLAGMPWFTSMFTPDPRGVVVPAGRVEGGHEWLVYGYHGDGPYADHFECRNSWGVNWGVPASVGHFTGGTFYIHRDHLGFLLTQQGDLCAALEISKR